MFDIHNIANLSGLSLELVRTFLPSVLDDIRDYTNRSFITSNYVSGDIIIQNGKIILPENVPNNIIVDSQIELKYSENNTKIYTIKRITDNIIETYEKLFDETFNGFLIKLSFNGLSEDDIASMIVYKRSAVKYSALKSESLDGYSYTLNVDSDNSTTGYPKNIMTPFNSRRQLPENRKIEYYERGFTKIPFRR